MLIVASASQALAGSAYIVTDLDSLGGTGRTYAYAINASGQVTGYSSVSSPPATRAFLYDGVMHDVGPPGSLSAGLGINDSGHVAGSTSLSRAFLYDGAFHDLGTLGGRQSKAYDVNNQGLVTGEAETGRPFAMRAFVYDGTMHDLGTLGGATSTGMAINDLGRVTGYSQIAGSPAVHAFLYDGVMHNLGTLGGQNSLGRAINEAGIIVGWSNNAAGSIHAMMYDGSMHDLGTLGGNQSYAYGINASGQVVGSSDKAGGGMAAFLYQNGQMLDLNSLIVDAPGLSLLQADAINDAGQIVAWGRINGADRAYLLTPVPEPAGATLAASASLALLVVCRTLLRSRPARAA